VRSKWRWSRRTCEDGVEGDCEEEDDDDCKEVADAVESAQKVLM